MGHWYQSTIHKVLTDIDLHFINKHDAELTDFVIGSLQEQDETWSVEHFFPSPYWDDQVNAIDNAVWDFINSKTKRTIKITTTKWYSKTATLEMTYPKGVKLDDIDRLPSRQCKHTRNHR
jgi:arabinogalactan endo-1,4-beta-galactosidase